MEVQVLFTAQKEIGRVDDGRARTQGQRRRGFGQGKIQAVYHLRSSSSRLFSEARRQACQRKSEAEEEQANDLK